MRLTGDLARSDIEALLVELGAELDSRGTRGELFVIGGAAMALAYDTRRSTRDIDGVFEPKSVVYAAAAIVGSRHGLDEGWLNDAAKTFITPTVAEGATVVLDAPGIRVSVPAPERLLALKVASGRVDRDSDDIRFLADRCGLTSASEILDLTERVIGSARPLEPKVQYLIEGLFGPDT